MSICRHTRRSIKLTTASFATAYGVSFIPEESARLSRAMRWNPAPGNHSGTCFTARSVGEGQNAKGRRTKREPVHSEGSRKTGCYDTVRSLICENDERVPVSGDIDPISHREDICGGGSANVVLEFRWYCKDIAEKESCVLANKTSMLRRDGVPKIALQHSTVCFPHWTIIHEADVPRPAHPDVYQPESRRRAINPTHKSDIIGSGGRPE